MSEVLCVIIGRRGSKGVPGKNAAVVAGRPVVLWSVEHALAADTVDRVIVSTDCPQVTAAARGAGVDVVQRPDDLASDSATVDSAVRHAVETVNDPAPIVVILYANVPVRPHGLIDQAVGVLRDTGADSVQSYAPVGKYHPQWMVRLDERGSVTPYEESRVYRRQDLPPVHIPDGGVIAVRRESLFTVIPGEPHAFLGCDRRGVMTGAGDVIDIDLPIDLIVASSVLEQKPAHAPGALP
ncbi:MAG: acylneuraminate cytidylyltransferase family protein [Phycisphaerales bacterium]|nr:acylneuraminate cytidylyltransferase family protein [Phycisphaerales bacterium]